MLMTFNWYTPYKTHSEWNNGTLLAKSQGYAGFTMTLTYSYGYRESKFDAFNKYQILGDNYTGQGIVTSGAPGGIHDYNSLAVSGTYTTTVDYSYQQYQTYDPDAASHLSGYQTQYWYIEIKNPFIITKGSTDIRSPTCYIDCIKASKINPLHYRDQCFTFGFEMTANFVTDLDNMNLFQIYDPVVLEYYQQLVNAYYPPLGQGQLPSLTTQTAILPG